MAFETDERGNRTNLPWRGGPLPRSYRVILRDDVWPVIRFVLIFWAAAMILASIVGVPYR